MNISFIYMYTQFGLTVFSGSVRRFCGMHYLNVVTANVKVTLASCMNRRHVGSGSIAPCIPYFKLMKMSDQSHTVAALSPGSWLDPRASLRALEKR
jgi:hypothetical protein